jgi:phosphoribosylaminoimidazole-succinocarboxamide synthase
VVALSVLTEALKVPLEASRLEHLGKKYQGKVRDNYTTADGRRYIVVTDRISAFDRVLTTLPLKGQVLNHVAAWWFEKTAHIAPNHLLSCPDPNVTLAEECTPLPVELVVRAYLTGTTSTSIWVHYQRGERRYCGHDLPDGLGQHQRLPEVIVTPSSKAEHGDHDVSLSREEILNRTGMPAEEFDEAARLSLALFREGQRLCGRSGLILVDTKYEFGKTRDGRIVLIDEIHTPDSSRFWFESSYKERFVRGEAPESFDKEYVRRYLKDQGFSGDGPVPHIPDEVRVEASRRYIHAVEQITGEPFKPNLEEPHARMAANLPGPPQ